jgi:long-chain acyl-CoA synthetase
MSDTGFWKVAEAHPDRLAVVDPEWKETSFGELAALTHRIVHGLHALGLRKGDQVTTLLPNGIEQLATCLAAFQSGLYVTAVNFHLVGPEIAYIVNDSETKAFIVDARFAGEAVRTVEEGIGVPDRARFAVGDVAGFRSFAELVDGQPDTPADERPAGSYMFYTSGTTGRPKGVRRALPPIDADTMAGMSGGFFGMFGITPHDDNVHITQAPLYHTAVNNFTTQSLHLGHTVTLMDRWTPEAALERYERSKVTHSHMVPTMFHRLLALPDDVKARYDLSSLRCMIHAAAPCPVETKQKMLAWWGPVIWEYYAATEGGGTIVSPQEWLEHPGTVGRNWPGADVRVFDADGNECPTGTSGTIYLKLPAMGFEYYKDKEKTDKNRLGDYFTVGDVGYFDAEGFLYLNDRATDMIISGGVNIYPAEIEGALQQHDKVADVAVFGIPNPDTGEEIKAVVQPADGVEGGPGLEAELREFLSGRIAKQKWPQSYDFLPELPRDPNGKLYKRKLRDPYWEGRTGKIV